MMKRLVAIGLIVVLLSSCNRSTQIAIPEEIESKSPTESTTNPSGTKDTLLVNTPVQEPPPTPTYAKPTPQVVQKKETQKEIADVLTRYMEMPSDSHFNGKPMTQQIELSHKIVTRYPDTLSKITVARYKTYDHFFPIAIADNFEQGISTEIIMYPEKLIFQFQVFENEQAAKPYLTRNITIRRDKAGNPYAE